LTEHSERKKRLRREWLITTTIALSLLALLVFADIARPLGNVLYDHLLRLQGFRATQDIVVIAIDDRSLQELGGWPLQRAQYSKLLGLLDEDCCRPKVIGFDLLFLDGTAEDIQLGVHLKELNSVLPLTFEIQDDDPLSLQEILPVAPLVDKATLGHINLAFDTDGVIRGVQTSEQKWPHFALALQQKGEPSKDVLSANKGYRRFRMVDPRIGFPMISLVDALHSQASRTLLKNKYVLVGVTAPSLGDRYPTLYSGKNNSSTPGVAILASVLNASLNDALIKEASPWALFSLTLIPLLLMLQSLVMLAPRYALLMAILMMLGGVAISYELLAIADYWVDPIPFVLIAALIHPLWAWRRLEAIVHVVQGKTADLRQFQPSQRNSQAFKSSREIVLQHAKLLDHAVASARSELDFLSTVVDEMPEAVFIFNEQHQLLLSNQKVKDLFSIYPITTGCGLAEFEEHLKLPLSAITATQKQNGQARTQKAHRLNTAFGERDFILKSASLDSPLSQNLLLLILMDVTELQQSQTQRDRALQFLSHDMRTPIASILSLTGPNTKRSDTELQCEKIVHHAQALLGMMDDFILAISAEAQQYNMQLVLLDNLLNDSLEQVVDLAAAKKIELCDQSSGSDIFVMADTRLLIRAITNLLFNAIKFSPQQSNITIQTNCQHDVEKLRLVVTITISNLVDNRSEKKDLDASMLGFGLGLDFVNNVIRKHNGSITRNFPIKGFAAVNLTLPCEISESATEKHYK
jgi:CHASE2 domain-containing sensor protein/nitrogen-specific signal transduction histidine kinase